jgi:GNAT superfamily N-acetyltransferase
MAEPLISLRMVRDSVSGIPHYDLSAPFSFRFFTKGDEKSWLDIQGSAEKYLTIDDARFRNEFGSAPHEVPRRMLFIVNAEGRAVGTATAWFNTGHPGIVYGCVHWVAIHPEFQGKGLARPLISRCCEQCAELGHDRLWLMTDSARIRAIRIYASFGFVPEIDNEDDRRVWRTIKRQIPELEIPRA